VFTDLFPSSPLFTAIKANLHKSYKISQMVIDALTWIVNLYRWDLGIEVDCGPWKEEEMKELRTNFMQISCELCIHFLRVYLSNEVN
jgi:hypothetical protein